jgi:hypothetical protein
VIRRCLSRMQKARMAAIFNSWLDLEPSLIAYQPQKSNTQNLESPSAEKSSSDDENASFISFLSKKLVKTIEATAELGLQGQRQHHHHHHRHRHHHHHHHHHHYHYHHHSHHHRHHNHHHHHHHHHHYDHLIISFFIILSSTC